MLDDGAERAAGVFCLANDAVADWLVAFCTSLRRQEPTRRLVVIPFDERVERTRRLGAVHGFELLEHPSLRRLDELGRRLWPDRPGRAPTLRKLAAFWGPLETFLFLDSDIVVLRSPAACFAAFARGDRDLLYARADLDQVYRPGPVRVELVARHGAQGFNTGAFLSRRGALTLDGVEAMLPAALRVREHFADTLEQPYLNFWADVGGLRVGPLRAACPELADAWAGMRLRRRPAGLVLDDPRLPEEAGRPVWMVHWAGFAAGPLMPHRRLFLAHRLAGLPRGARARYRGRAVVAAMAAPRRSLGQLVARLRSSWVVLRAGRYGRTPMRPV